MTTGRINQVRVRWLKHKLHKQLFPSFRCSPSTKQGLRANLHKHFHIMLPTSETISLSNQQFQNAPSIPQGSQATLPNCTHNANPAAAHLQAQQA